MASKIPTVYNRFLGIKVPDDLAERLDRFSRSLGRQRSDVIRYLLVSCLNAYEGDRTAMAKIKQELH
jgi:metal-responsive CopG/Arc/MetJ family transcriptional regulator